MSYMRTQLLTSNGLQNAEAIVKAADEFDLELAVAAAFAEQESGGSMVYGHDLGGTYSTNKYGYNVPEDIGKHPTGSNIPVTRDNYWGNSNIRGFYNRVVVDGGKSNGVGIYQITYKGFIVDADNNGFDLADPLGNARYGVKLIKSYIKDGTDEQIQRAACKYYTGLEDEWQTNFYPLSVMRKVQAWRNVLEEANEVVQEPPADTEVDQTTPEPPAPVTEETDIDNLPVIYMYTTSALNLREEPSISGKYILTMPPRVRVQLTNESRDNWFKVYYNGKLGWCHGSYLVDTRPKKRWWHKA